MYKALILLLACFAQNTASTKKNEDQYKDVQMLRRAKPTDFYKDVFYPRKLYAQNLPDSLNQTPLSESLLQSFDELKQIESLELIGGSFGLMKFDFDWQDS